VYTGAAAAAAAAQHSRAKGKRRTSSVSSFKLQVEGGQYEGLRNVKVI
jgi:hypothetical protein